MQLIIAGVVRSLRELPSYFVTRVFFCDLEIIFGALSAYATEFLRNSRDFYVNTNPFEQGLRVAFEPAEGVAEKATKRSK